MGKGHIPAAMQLHATCLARDDEGLLLLGSAGAGKSDLALRLLDHGFLLVADDRVDIEAGRARAPAALAGLLEVRGLGIFRLPFRTDVRLVLAEVEAWWVDSDFPADKLSIIERLKAVAQGLSQR